MANENYLLPPASAAAPPARTPLASSALFDAMRHAIAEVTAPAAAAASAAATAYGKSPAFLRAASGTTIPPASLDHEVGRTLGESSFWDFGLSDLCREGGGAIECRGG